MNKYNLKNWNPSDGVEDERDVIKMWEGSSITEQEF